MKVLLLLFTALLLSACQSPNPYTAQSAPIPPAPPEAAQHFDASAYPSAPMDFTRFQSWRWASAPVTTANGGTPDQVRDAVANALEQHGLRPSTTGAADLVVNASLRTERRVQHVRDSYGSYGGYYGDGPYWRDRYGYGTSVNVPITRTYEVEVGVLRVDFRDSKGQSIWSGSTELSARGDQADRRNALYEAAKKVLEDYPQH